MSSCSSSPLIGELTPSRKGNIAFTLVELMVAIAVAALITVFLASMVNQTGMLWRNTRARIEQYRDARDGFEAISRRLSQATLNTYWDYYYPAGQSNVFTSGSTAVIPTGYGRQSELRFICLSGSQTYPAGASVAFGGTGTRVTHATFFQAPLGFVGNSGSYGRLANLLNTWGYYVEFNQELTLPAFINQQIHPPRYRFRLMEMMQPSENLSLYNYTSGTTSNGQASKNSQYYGTQWFTDAFIPAVPPVHILAENVVALVLLPRLSIEEDATGAELAPGYSYDSTTVGAAAALSGTAAAVVDSRNQLPPVVQVTMVAVDETSYSRLQSGSQIPQAMQSIYTSGTSGLFQQAGNLSDATKPGYAQDLQTLENTLQAQRLNYRVFTTNVIIKSAKWSRQQTN